MKEPRRWLEDTSPEAYELRRLLEAAETPRPMNPDERLRAAERIEALDARASLPVHRILPDFSLVMQWWSDFLHSIQPAKRAKPRARLIVLVVVVLVMVALTAAAAPLASHWWNAGFSHNIEVKKAKTPAPIPWAARKIVVPPKNPNILPEPSPSAPMPEMTSTPAPSPSSPPMITSTRKLLDDAPIAPLQDVPDEPSDNPAVNAPQAANSQNPKGSRITADLALLDEAQALVGTNPSGALMTLGRHEREFPATQFGLQRELLYVEALRKAGRLSEARARAKGNLERARGRSTEGKWQQVVDSLQ